MRASDGRARTHPLRARARGEELLGRLLLALPARNIPPVLAYHHVGPRIPGVDPGLSIDATSFERHVTWLARHGFVGLTASQWLDGVQGRHRLPPRPVLLTFDDGYAALADDAFPILRRHGFGATVFLVTGLLGATSSWLEASEAHVPLLGREEVRAWAADGIEFGSHTRTHPLHLERQPERWPHEVEGSSDDLADLLDSRPRCFAYPYGHVDGSLRRAVSRVYDVAFTVDEGANRPDGDLHLIRRSGALEEDTPGDLALRVRAGWTPRHRVRIRVRRRLGKVRRTLTRRHGR